MLLLLILSLAQRPEAPLSIHVAPKTIVDATGFREPITKEVTDSVSDLQTELRRRYRGLRLVPTPEDADVSLLVVGRVRTSTPSGAIAMPIGRGAVAAPTYAHRAILRRVGVRRLHEKVFEASESNWRRVAERIAKDATAWMNANYDTIKGKVKR